MMRLPTDDSYLSKQKFKRCIFCNKPIDHGEGFATVCGGAIEKKPTADPIYEKIEGFFDIGFNGPSDDFDVSAIIRIVEEGFQGQFELYTCSTKCLRKFFSALIDRLELKVEKETVAVERRKKRYLKSRGGAKAATPRKMAKSRKRIARGPS